MRDGGGSRGPPRPMPSWISQRALGVELLDVSHVLANDLYQFVVKGTLCPDVWLPWTGLAITPVPAADPGQYDASDEAEQVALPRDESAERQQPEDQPSVEDGHSHGYQDGHEAPLEEPTRYQVAEVAEHQAARADVDSISACQPDARAREHRNEDRDCQQRPCATHAHEATQHQQWDRCWTAGG